MEMKHTGMKDMQDMDNMQGMGHMHGSDPAPHAQAEPCPPDAPPDPTLGGHGQLIVGEEQAYLSHLPMFMFDPCEHPHNFQVILEVSFTGMGQDPAAIYRKDRQESGSLLYTLDPEAFVMTDLVSPDREHPRLTSFTGTIYRQHFERPNPHRPDAPRHKELTDTKVNVSHVVYFHEFERDAQRPPALTYLLFGKGGERFLAHQITRRPDFDHVVAAQVTGHDFTDDDLCDAVRISIPGRRDDAAHRLKSGERVTGQTDDGIQVEMQIGPEFYFEERELS